MNDDAIQVENMKRLGYTMPDGIMLARAEAFLSQTVPLWRRAPADRQELLLLSTHRGLIAADAVAVT